MIKSLSIVCCLLLICCFILACGKTQNAVVTSAGNTNTSSSAITQEPAGATSWNGVPLYPSAKQISLPASTPELNKNYKKIENRIYETSDNLSDVMAYYKTELPASNWQPGGPGWTDVGSKAYGQYYKNNGDIWLSLTITAGQNTGDKTSILMTVQTK